MKYRLRLDLIFPGTATLADLQSVRQGLASFFTSSIILNEGQANEERGFIILEKCKHDTDPPGECVIFEKYVTGRGRVI